MGGRAACVCQRCSTRPLDMGTDRPATRRDPRSSPRDRRIVLRVQGEVDFYPHLMREVVASRWARGRQSKAGAGSARQS